MRILLVLILASLTGIAGYWSVYLKNMFDGFNQEISQKNEAIEKLGIELDESEAKRRELEISNHLLKVDHRVARIEVLEQIPDPNSDGQLTTLLFQELNHDGKTSSEGQRITVEGSRFYLETLVIKFEDSYVEGGDYLRGSSVCLFKSIYGENQKPVDGEPVDTEGTHPHPYASGDGEDDLYYAQLWQNFWEYANDKELAKEKGVRAIHGEAPWIEARPGMKYRIELRASGGLDIKPE